MRGDDELPLPANAPRAWALVLAVVLAGGIASAGDAAPPEVHPSIDEIRAHDRDASRRLYVLGRIHWDYPAKLAGATGVILARLPRDYDCTTTCLLRGLTVQGGAGLGAGSIAVGYGSLVGETGRSRRLLRHVYVGWGARAAFARTWGASALHPEGASYAGIETGVTVAQFSVTIGAFRRIGPALPGADWRVFGGAGWGF